MKENWESDFYLYKMLKNFQIENDILYGCNVFKLCDLKGWELIPYPKEKHAILCGISTDGFTKYKDNQFYIFYNPEMPKRRINFTIAHEIGHIVLYHHFYVGDLLLSNTKSYCIWEKQADTFAQNLLMPAQITNEFKKFDIESLSRYFNVSGKMIVTRLNKLHKDLMSLKKYNLI